MKGELPMISNIQAQGMRKGGRLLGLLSPFCLAAFFLCSCASKETGLEEPGQSAAEAGSYAYEQELNIIDDNCRNYYEIFVRSFYDSDGDGIGDLNGVTEKLDYIEEMGFNGIWLMPIMPSPTYHKYDVTDYYGVDSQYGTVEDFARLTQECHSRGIRVAIDFVINHTSSQHEWFRQACAYLKELPEGEEPDLSECPYVGYYHFSRENGGEGFYRVPGSGWYYEGSFWSEMPDLDLSCKPLKQELERVADHWLELGADGFRMDAAMHFEERDQTFNEETLNWLYTYCRQKNPDFYMVSEVWANRSVIADYYQSRTPSMFNFDAAGAEGQLIKAARGNLSAAGLTAAMQAYQEEFGGVYEDYIDAPFLTNHDMNRVANALMNDAGEMKMACGLLMMMNGSPFVYYGEEIGMASKGIKDESKRTAMYWSRTDQTGMTENPDGAEVMSPAFLPVDEQLEDEDSILNYYRRALRLRNENPEIARGEISLVESLCSGSQAAIQKTWQGSTLGIVYNTGEEPVEIALSGTGLETMGIRGYLTADGGEVTIKDGRLSMPARSICILK